MERQRSGGTLDEVSPGANCSQIALEQCQAAVKIYSTYVKYASHIFLCLPRSNTIMKTIMILQIELRKA